MTRVPDLTQLVVLSLAAWRAYRIGARDTITEPIRAALSYPDKTAVTLAHDTEGLTIIGLEDESKPPRVYLATLIRCPWCAGFYVSVAAWLLWEAWPRATLVGSTPLAISALVGLITKNLDKEA